MTQKDITPSDSVVRVYLEPISELELKARQAETEIISSAQTERSNKVESAITKLKALGLTETEAKIIIGIE
jgi:hypothetical protein